MNNEFKIEKCVWKNGSKSPVVLMIDDLANKWIKIKQDNNIVRGSDWGYCKYRSNSFWSILNNELLNKYPHIKCTMFLVVGRREGIIKNGNDYVSYNIRENNFGEFLKHIIENNQFELAYHGLTHGKNGDTIKDFIEEWNTFDNEDEALKVIKTGTQMYEEIVSKKFTGGKYCGYLFNDFSDITISKSEFKWWCRHWDSPLLQNYQIKNNVLSLELDYFDNVVDIPSTIDGSFYTLKNYKKLFTKKYLKSLYYKFIKNITLESQIEYLINNNLIVSIQEHTAKYRVDNRIQYPNIVSDIENLNYIFKYLKKYDLWYATCGEIADYYRAYTKSRVIHINNEIKIECEKEVEDYEISISLNSDANKKYILIRDNKAIEGIRKNGKNIFNIKLKNDDIYSIQIVD